MNSKTLNFTVPDQCDNMDANTFLRKHCKISARMITRLKREENGICNNGKLLKTIDFLRAGDIVTLNLPNDKNEIVPIEGAINILYEDNHIIALDKPAQMPVHPTKVHQLDTLANRVVYYAKEKGENYSIRIINRLDRDTTGVVIIAKDRFTANSLQKTMIKTYEAVCCGVIECNGTIDAPIKIKGGHTIERTVRPDGDRAITHYFPIKNNGKYTLLEITLETGRTHQIRCHFSYIGHPLAGDDMYGGIIDDIARQALHCCKIEFIHPITKKNIVIESPLPPEIKNIF